MEDSYMTCNVCGAEIPAGAAMCPICGAQAPSVPQGGYQMVGGNAAPSSPFGADPANRAMMGAQNYGGYNPEPAGYDPYAQPEPIPPVPTPAPKKSNTGLIIGIIAGVAVVAALVVCWVLGVFGGGNKAANGNYKFDHAEYGGLTMDPNTMNEALKQMGYNMDVSDFYLKIDGTKATVQLMGMTGTCSVKFNGDNVTFTENGRDIEGVFDEAAKTISLEQSGAKLIFKMQ